jgi:RNA polymerase sigma-70 factor (ECF subfamily)
MSDELSDAEALRRLRTDPDAICVLYDRYVTRLVGGLVRSGVDRELAWDVTQETFARLLEKGHRVHLPSGGTLAPWLQRVARNLVVDAWRRGAADTRALARLGISRVHWDDDVAARLDVRSAFATLPIDQRRAVAARIAGDLTYEELARAAGTTEVAARARVSRGLRALRLRLSGGKP